MHRPVGITIILAWFLFAAFAGFIHAFFNPFNRTGLFYYLFTLGALFYGFFALATAVGLWKMKSWSYMSFLSWCAVVLINLIFYQYVARLPMLKLFAFLAIMFAILFPVGRYISKCLKTQSNPPLQSDASRRR